jgi:LETM1 and EF-hand domain-containing protein 1, mitochondrial
MFSKIFVAVKVVTVYDIFPQLVRTTSDLFRLVPFSVFVIVPFMELLLPVALKLFPGMLPSTFTTKSEREAKMKRTLTAKLEYAKFLQKTLDEMAPKGKGRDSKSASDFVNFYQKIKTQGREIVNNEEILKYSKLFEDDITLGKTFLMMVVKYVKKPVSFLGQGFFYIFF